MKIGFACIWQYPPEKTWSGTPWNLRKALINVPDIDVIDIGPEFATKYRGSLFKCFKALYARRKNGKLISKYGSSQLYHLLCRYSLNKKLKFHPVDVVLEIGDIANVKMPFYLYQDLSYDVLVHYYKIFGVPLPGFPALDIEDIYRLRDRQRIIYQQAAGIFTMSKWLARTLVEWSEVPVEKVHAVYAGTNAGVLLMEGHDNCTTFTTHKQRLDRNVRDRLLFVGRDFYRKGGDLVVKALQILRKEFNSKIYLSIAGPSQWPMQGNIPDGVNFLGNIPPEQVAMLYFDHDLFVMPSRFEAFGIVFIEALSSGIPCIGRNEFAMPEIIEPGVTGYLLENDDPLELAELIAKALQDDQLYINTLKKRAYIKNFFSWDRVASDMVNTFRIKLNC